MNEKLASRNGAPVASKAKDNPALRMLGTKFPSILDTFLLELTQALRSA